VGKYKTSVNKIKRKQFQMNNFLQAVNCEVLS